MPVLAAEYRRPEHSFGTLGEKYGVSPSTIRNRLHRWADETGTPWPMKVANRGANRDVVDPSLAASEVLYACAKFRISQTTLAGLCGLGANHLHKLTSGRLHKIKRKTQGTILEVVSRLDAGELVVEPEPVILPTKVRTTCPNGHAYTGLRDSRTGRRLCVICRTQKHNRRLLTVQAQQRTAA